MNYEKKTKVKKSKKIVSSVILYVAAIVVALIGIGLLVDNVIIFKTTISQYVSQGYSAATVEQQLIPSQLLPAIFNSIGIYGGISFVLVGIGIINTKLSKHLFKDEQFNEESTLEINTPDTAEEITKSDERSEDI
ncbi:hypothetical protein [Clostridium sp.]|uniref:hypothetical protein n=1 Tax=Clostridium sp. TaxID=1506 RepID=UPI0025855E60|nr:hypothetical protein [Clostridium sp.]MDF2503961.1 hypothetical protein [Clostridium sp.]